MRWTRRPDDSRDVVDVRGRSSGIPGGRVALPGGVGLVGVQRPERLRRRNAGGRRPRPYRHAKLYLYTAAIDTGCGSATSAVGSFYCPADGHVYLDLSFYRDMQQQLGADGDFAWAYVIAHEMGHHVQRQLGTSDKVSRLEQDSPDQRNQLSVRLELQADCYAGVWARSVLEAGDLDETDIPEAMRAAAAVGDDRLQKRARGTIEPDTFTHGTSAQRAHWFDTGRGGGEPAACDTFTPETV
jgi:predicted metalloprotease